MHLLNQSQQKIIKQINKKRVKNLLVIVVRIHDLRAARKKKQVVIWSEWWQFIFNFDGSNNKERGRKVTVTEWERDRFWCRDTSHTHSVLFACFGCLCAFCVCSVALHNNLIIFMTKFLNYIYILYPRSTQHIAKTPPPLYILSRSFSNPCFSFLFLPDFLFLFSI